MIRTWTSSQYLGHQNLKNALDAIKRSLSNVALTPVLFTLQPTTVSNFGRGGMLRLGTAATNGTFLYRIEDTFYIKGTGTASALTTGDTTPCLLPHNPDLTVDQTAAYEASDITAGYYRAGVVLIDADGNWSVVVGELTGRTDGVGTSGARDRALAKLVDVLDTDDLKTKAIACFYVIGDGSSAFTSTSTLTIATNLDIYNCGGMTLSTGVSTDGNQILGLL